MIRRYCYRVRIPAGPDLNFWTAEDFGQGAWVRYTLPNRHVIGMQSDMPPYPIPMNGRPLLWGVTKAYRRCIIEVDSKLRDTFKRMSI